MELLSVDGSLCFMNEAGRSLREFEPGAVPVGKSWASLWPGEARPLVHRAVTIAGQGGTERFTAFARTARGRLKWWDVVVTPILGGDGSIDSLLSISRDITQETMSEVALRSSEQRFRGLADNMAQLTWMADANGSVFWYNKRWLDYAGVTTEAMAADGWYHVYHPDFRDRIKERMAVAFERREMWEDQIPLRAADGTYRWFLSRAVPVTDDTGRLALWCATHTDITEQRNLSHRLRQLARVVELSHEAILVWDLEGGIALWNNGCEELYGYSRAEAVGKRSSHLLATQRAEDLESILRKNGEWSGELRHRGKGGNEIWVDSRQEVIRAGGRNLVIETNRDITERRKADELRERLVAELDHRVKNNLAIVQAIAARMAYSQPSLPEFMARFSGRIQSLAISQSVLSDAHWSGAELSNLIRSQISLILPSSERLRLEGPPVMVPPELALQLTLILHELAANASLHGALAQPGGEVQVTWREGPAPRSLVMIDWIEKGGPPVAGASGYGFGRRLIERTGRLPHLKAELQLRPEGAHCRIVLDYAKLNAPARSYFRSARNIAEGQSAHSPARPARMAGRRILLIEEDPLELIWMEDVLADAGYLIIGLARTMDSALCMIETTVYDMAIVDRSGRTLDAERLLDRLATLGKPSITLVAGDDSSSKGHALIKPLDARSLIAALQRLRGGS
jgi:PAS domain S-box-containing protein